MKENSEGNTGIWKRPLRGMSSMLAWTLLIVGLAVIIRLILGFTVENAVWLQTPVPWLVAFGLAVAAAILLAVSIQCLSNPRDFKRALIGFAIVAGTIGLFYAEESLRGRLAWRSFKSHWEAKGEKFEFAAFVPNSVPASSNFAMAPLIVGTYGQCLDPEGRVVSPRNTNIVNRLQLPLDAGDGGPTNGTGNWQKALPCDLQPWQNYYRKLAQSTNIFPSAPQPQTPAADVLLALSKYDPIIEELRQAAALPGSRFPLNYESEEPFAILLPHLAPAKGCTQALRLRALAELEDGKSEMALQDISLALSLTEKFRSEPFLISHLVRIAMLQITEQPIWEGLRKHCWNDAQLQALEKQLGGFDFATDYQVSMRGECACQVASAEYLRHHPEQISNTGSFDNNHSPEFPESLAHFVPSGWFYQNSLRSSKFILEHYVPIADDRTQTFSPDLVKQANGALQTMRLTPYTLLCKLFLPGLQNCPRKFAFAQTTINLSRTACALERYRLAQGKYPAALDSLAQQFISKVPLDPIGGKSLNYHLTDDGQFILYSMGWNENDDGGNISLNKNEVVDLNAGDWVWRYPQTQKPQGVASIGVH